ncbi:metal-dependent transcriptional regulator [Tersicoccus sp. MR15.9]|uniref:metal-dependent transcriptional regulator n=1 Tax=Tersicoccus mangrovi TaxID=3121635 RepID=UPI002FE66DCE
MVEDYLTLIWKAREWPTDGRLPTTSDLAASLSVTPPSVTANLKKLARQGLIEYEPYGEILLTEAGQEIAVQVVRRHRIIETYLMRFLGLTWDQVHAEADELEHAISPFVLERMDAALGYPAVDPHGHPIPGRAEDERPPGSPLSTVEVGQLVVVVRVSDLNPGILRYLADAGITIGTELTIDEALDDTGLLTARVEGGRSFQCSAQIAGAVFTVPTAVPTTTEDRSS